LIESITKKCNKCKEILSINEFSKRTLIGRVSVQPYCKKCANKIRIERNYNLNRKVKRHELGISKAYSTGPKGPALSLEQKKENAKQWRKQNNKKVRIYRKKYKYNKKMAGELTTKTIQLVYEDNIKKYGTLTCYLCLSPIEMQKEHLEHKNPLSRGGTNDYENLGIACSHCNRSKRNKTVAEYLGYLNKKKEKVN